MCVRFTRIVADHRIKNLRDLIQNTRIPAGPQMAHINWLYRYDAEKHCASLNDFKKIEELFEKSMENVVIKPHEIRAYYLDAKDIAESILKKRNIDANNQTNITAVNSPIRAQIPSPTQPSPKKPRTEVIEFVESLINPDNKDVAETVFSDLPADEFKKLKEQFEQQLKSTGKQVSPTRG